MRPPRPFRPLRPCRLPRRAERRRITGALLVALASQTPCLPAFAQILPPAASSATTASAAHTLYLDVHVNGAARGLHAFTLREGRLWTDAATLRALHFTRPSKPVSTFAASSSALAAPTGDSRALDTLDGVAIDFDAATQSLALTVPLALLTLPVTVIGPPPAPPPQPRSSPGLLLNYDLHAGTGAHGTRTLGGLGEARLFGPYGVLSHSTLARSARADRHDDWQTRAIRLDTEWRSEFADRMLSVSLGDFVSGAQSWSRPTRMGGLRIARDFGLQPYRLTMPLPQLAGQAALPSTVELFVNGMRHYQGAVPAGPFELGALSGLGSPGQAELIVTDALGRSTTLSVALHDSRDLLQQGLWDGSLELGTVRRHYGQRSSDYASELALSGFWRYGLSPRFTVELQGEHSDGLAKGGLGGMWLAGPLGTLWASAAYSDDGNAGRRAQGAQYVVGHRLARRHFVLGGSAAWAERGYRDLAALHGSPVPRVSASAYAGVNGARFGNFGVHYFHLRHHDEHAARHVGAWWSRSLGTQAALGVSFGRNVGGDRHDDWRGAITLTWTPGRGTTHGAGVRREGAETRWLLSTQRVAPTEGGWGWRAGLERGTHSRRAEAEFGRLTRHGEWRLGARDDDGAGSAWAEASGGLIWMGGQGFATRRVDQSFALVSTDGIANVPVQLENQPIGMTDERGQLLITPLRAYDRNLVSIDPLALPAAMRVERVRAEVTPGGRAGTLVRFGLTPLRAAQLSLVDHAGQPLPLGSTVRISRAAADASDAAAPTTQAVIGYDGLVYLEQLTQQQRLHVQRPDGRSCAVELTLPEAASAGAIARLGPLTCAEAP